jgi:hypothetical protein
MSGADPGFYVRGRISWRGVNIYVPCGTRAAPGAGGGAMRNPLRLLGIRKYRTSFLNRNWLKCTMCGMMLHIEGTYNEVWYFTHDVRPCYDFNEEQKSEAFACFRKIGVILFNAHYPISLRSKEKELICVFEIVLGRGKWTYLKQNGKEQVKNILGLRRMHGFQITVTSTLKLINNW